MPEPDPPPDLIWIELHFETNQSQSGVDDYVSVPRAEWDAMTEIDREEYIQQAADDFADNIASWGGGVVDADQVPARYRKDAGR